jgi:redox-sensitive bicupin YhaK (pirin superfamily)
MISHRPWASLEKADLGWLRAGYHFPFGPNGNAAHAAIGPLIVWNDDEIAVGGGFPLHGHRDMEILTYVRQGAVGHKDDLGSETTLRAGDVQVMSAGTGIRHAEFNQGDVPLKIYQIWLVPRERGGRPQWSTRSFPVSERQGRFVVLASGDAEDEGAIAMRANGRLLAASLKAGQEVRHRLAPAHQAYLVVASGRIEVNGEAMGPQDGAAIVDLAAIHVVALDDAELLMVDVG